MVTLIQVDKGTLITVTFLCDDVITQSDTRKHINYAVIIDYDIEYDETFERCHKKKSV